MVSSPTNDIVWLTMRRMRTPLIVLILCFWFSVVLMLAVPGVDPDGNPIQLSFLDAAYFVAILATTIGFGEIPYSYTDAQRLLVLLIILPNVVAWLYSIGAILALILDPQFREVLNRARFARRVRWLGEPFYIVCGFGNTGRLVTRGLLHRGLRAVVLEKDEATVHRMSLEEEYAQVPALHCDTTDRRNIELAGLHRADCRGIIIATNDDHANLTIAVTSKLLAPRLPVFARADDEATCEQLESLGTEYIINPYVIFAERLYLALTSPVKYLVQDWLISVPGSRLRQLLKPPAGNWIVCGTGHFGERVVEGLAERGLPCTIIDNHTERLAKYPGSVRGHGTDSDILLEAGIETAAGIIAGYHDDMDNLSIVLAARKFNPGIFVVARQERQANDELFDKCGADLVARRSLIVARRILAVATTPLLQTFLQHLVKQPDDFAERTAARLRSVLHDRVPTLWAVRLTGAQAEGIHAAAAAGVPLALTHLTHNTRSDEGEGLPCVCLVLERGARRQFLPDSAISLLEGDHLLFAGRESARKEIFRALQDPVLLMDFATPYSMPRTAIGRWFLRRRQNRKSARSQRPAG